MVTRGLKTQAKAGHRFRQLESSVEFLSAVRVLRFKEIEWRVGCKFREAGIPRGVLGEPLILGLTRTPYIRVLNERRAGAAACKADSYALPYIEDVLVIAAIGRPLFLVRVTVKVEHSEPRKCCHQTLPHSTKGGVIEIPVVRDVPEDADAAVVDGCLRFANEFHVVILQPDLAFV